MANEAPIVDNYTKTTQENIPVTGRIAAVDPDGDALIYTLSKSPENGVSVVASNGEWTYIPNPNHIGNDTFEVMVDDQKGGRAISVVEITITAVHDIPIIKNEIVQTPRNIAVGRVTDTQDLDGDEFIFIVKKEPKHGKLTLSETNGNWIYQPNIDFVGVDVFEILIDDQNGKTAISNIIIAATPPKTVFKQFSVMENVTIPEVKPEAEDIVKVIADVEVVDQTIIETPVATSYEGQMLTGWKVIIEGLLKQKIEYIADEPTQSMHCAHFEVPFSTYLVLPKNFKPCTPIEIKSCIEDIYFEQLDKRNIFKNITLVLQACLME
ncbi:Ig-like domain-containing protein [Inediibacterium massiliense]|uniref:Ig-like domain-containing protein n=1 Tax=Inediibacterium massiliense TaxID=1658111 RepID=UPI0006B5DE49|nr:Ig-like domain-containing protein [Inediibacterium massiliense]